MPVDRISQGSEEMDFGMPMPPPSVALATRSTLKPDAGDAMAILRAGKEQRKPAQLSLVPPAPAPASWSPRLASHHQVQPTSGAAPAPSLVFKPSPPAHTQSKKKMGFQGLMESLSNPTLPMGQKGAPAVPAQKKAQAMPPRSVAPPTQKRPSQETQVLQLQSQVAVLMEHMSKMRHPTGHQSPDWAPASPSRFAQKPVRSQPSSSDPAVDRRLDQLDALVNKLEARLAERDLVNEGLQKTVHQLEARLEKFEQGSEAARNEALDAAVGEAVGEVAVAKADGTEVKKAAGAKADGTEVKETVGAKAGGTKAGGAEAKDAAGVKPRGTEVKEALSKVAEAAGDRAGRAAGLAAGKEASAGEYFPILQRLITLEAAIKRLAATNESHGQANSETKETELGALQQRKLALMIDEVARPLRERTDKVKKELARIQAGFEAMQTIAKLGLEVQQDVIQLRTEMEGLRPYVPGDQGTAPVASEGAREAAPGLTATQSYHECLEEAVRLLGDNDSVEERANAALAASLALKTEVVCVRQLLNGMNNGIMQQLHNLEDRMASSQVVERRSSHAGTNPEIRRSASKRSSIQGSSHQDSPPMSPVHQKPPLGPIQEEALAARITANVLNEVGPTLEAVAASMEEMDTVKDSTTKAGVKVDELSAGLMLVTTRLNERLIGVEKLLRQQNKKAEERESKGENPETVFNNLVLPTRTSLESNVSKQTIMRVQPRPLAPPTSLPRAETSVQQRRGPVTRTASGGYNYTAPGSNSARNSASGDTCEPDLGQGPRRNRLLHPNGRVQSFSRNMKRAIGGSAFNAAQPAAHSEEVAHRRTTPQRLSSPPILSPIASNGSGANL